jgi:hypothetical protein
MPPEQDYQLVSSSAFNNDKLWIFMAAQKFLNGGCGDTVQASQAFYETQPVNWFGLPTGVLVDLDFDQHWTIKNIIKIIKVDIDIDIDINYCPPNQRPPRDNISPIHFDPPKDRRTSNDPTPTNPTLNPIPPVRIADPGTTIKPVLDFPVRPIGKIGRGGRDDGGKTGRGDQGNRNIGRGDQDGGGKSDGGSVWKRPHLSLLNATGHGLNVTNTTPARTPTLTIGSRLNSMSMAGKGRFNAIR